MKQFASNYLILTNKNSNNSNYAVKVSPINMLFGVSIKLSGFELCNENISIYLSIVIYRQTVSLYHDSSVWLDM